MLLVNLTFSNSLYREQAGAPAQLWLEYDVDASNNTIALTASWFDKTSTRLPEALWLVINSSATDGFSLRKLGAEVGGSAGVGVMYNGSSHLHGSAYPARNSLMNVSSSTASFVCLGNPTPFPSPLPQNDNVAPGISYNLVNNIWGTNYPFVRG
jgi:hypothetical protein